LAEPAAPRGGARAPALGNDLRRKARGIARAPGVGGHVDPPARGQQPRGQRLRGKHVTAGAAGRDQRETPPAHLPARPSTSDSTLWGRERVSASSIPSVIPEAIADEPP